MQEIVGARNQLIQNVKSKGKVSDKQLKYFTHEKKPLTYYLLPNIHKKLHNVPGRPVITFWNTYGESF